MDTSALILMVTVQATVTSVTLYFFIKVLRTPPRAEPDSFDENDEDPR
jgi:hypothetical protein